MLRKLRLLSILGVIVLIISYLYGNYVKSTPSPIVKINNGKIQGIISLSRDGKEFYSYLGIPYAIPPVGPSNRFESPKAVGPWEGIWDASYYRPFCLQMEVFALDLVMGSEDCLYLNVFVPKNTENLSLPVMAYIHGGFFHIGSSEIAGPAYFIDENVILVTINYRLGALGFLNSGDGIVRGNMGLKDQNLALHWIQKNIKNFNGDSSKVTIFGESAGGASVHYHVISPKSKQLFSRAIHQSGSSLHHWTLYRNVKEQFLYFAKKFDCSQKQDSKQLVNCLKNIDGRTLVKAHQEPMDHFRPQISLFVPTIEVIKDEDSFLTEEPRSILESGRFNRIPLMTGCNSREGLFLSGAIGANEEKLSKPFDYWAPKTLYYPKELINVTSKLQDFYFGQESSEKGGRKNNLLQKYTDIIGDRYFSIETSQSALIESRFVPTYVYYYDYEGGFSLGALVSYCEGPLYPILNCAWGLIKNFIKVQLLGQTVPHMGASHGDEVAMLFSGYLQFLYSKTNDEKMSKDLVKLWTDFAKAKTPMQFRGVQWPIVKNGELEFLRISNNPAVIKEPFETRRKLWQSLNIPLA